MKHVFNLQGSRLRKLTQIRDKALIGRGVFSAVFEGSRENRVYKLSADGIAYSLLNDSAAKVRHNLLPKVYDDFGIVDEVRVGGEVYPVYLYEIERLYRMSRDNLAWHQAKVIIKAATKANATAMSGWPNVDEFEESVMTIEELRKMHHILPGPVRSVFTMIRDFGRMMGGNMAIDLHMGNFMARANDSLVLSDPICQVDLLKKVRHA